MSDIKAVLGKLEAYELRVAATDHLLDAYKLQIAANDGVALPLNHKGRELYWDSHTDSMVNVPSHVKAAEQALLAAVRHQAQLAGAVLDVEYVDDGKPTDPLRPGDKGYIAALTCCEQGCSDCTAGG